MIELWHYGINGTPQPPVERETLLTMLRTGKIHPLRDKVWRTGMAEWCAPSELPELDWEEGHELPVYRRMSFEWWAGMQAGYLGFFLIYIMLAKRSVAVGAMPDSIASMFYTMAMFCLFFGTSMAAVAAYRNWELIQGRGARTTPLKAVGLLFVPFFNAAWIWIVAPGLAEDYNRFCETRRDNPPRHTPRWFLILAGAFAFKWLMVFAAWIASLLKWMAIAPATGAPPNMNDLSQLQFLEIQLASMHWQILGTLVLSVAMAPVMYSIFRAVNHFAEDPERA